MAALATANSGVLTTDASGVPSIDTTNFVRQTTGMQMKGNNTNTAPPAGFIGERISTGALSASITNNTTTALGNITLTAGIWDISALCVLNTSVTSLTSIEMIIGTTSASFTGFVPADNYMQTSTTTGALFSAMCACIPAFRVTISSNTTYYLNIRALFASGTCTNQGRMSGVRVG